MALIELPAKNSVIILYSNLFNMKSLVFSIAWVFYTNFLDNNNFRPYALSKAGDMAKIFGITILFFGLLAVVTTYQDLSPFWFSNSSSDKIETLWKQDMELLVRSKTLPKEWLDVSEIKFFPLTETTKELLTKIRPPLGTHDTGKYRMEVTVDDWLDTENGKSDYGLMIQYQIFDVASQNLIWELGRTLILANSEIKERAIKEKSEVKEISNEKRAQTPSNDKTK